MTRLLVLLVICGCAAPDDGLKLTVQDTSPPPEPELPQISHTGCWKVFTWVNPTEDILDQPLALSDLSYGTFYFGGDFEWQERVTMPTNVYQAFVRTGYWAAYLTVTHVNGAESAPSNIVDGTC